MTDELRPMPIPAMCSLVENAVREHGPFMTDVDLSGKYPAVLISEGDGSHPWAQITLGDEVFSLTVDRGYRLYSSEFRAPEQAELLEELVGLATTYLEGRFSIGSTRSLLGREKSRMTISSEGTDHVLSPVRR